MGIDLQVCKCPSDTHALANVLYVHPDDLPSSWKHVAVNSHYYYQVRPDTGITRGCIGASTLARSYMGLALNERVSLEPFDPQAVTPNCFIDCIQLGVGLMRKGSARNEVQFDGGKMAGLFREAFAGQILSIGQPVVMESGGIMFRLAVHSITTVNLEALSAPGHKPLPMSPSKRLEYGVLMEQSGVTFTAEEGEPITVSGGGASSALAAHPIIQPHFRFEDMGIGGLADEFGQIFRRAFASRIFPPELIKRLGIQHVKGVLLHGPPGTGKTLIARQIGKMLNAREPKIVNGPEVLSKYVGQSEENVRELFREAETEYKARGEASQLHIIIFDELDAICRQRGSRSDSTGVGDQVVNQLLSKLDGVEQLNNILVIGMTNRLDLIDEALLRPGRLEVHLEIGLPDEPGRLEILRIHTASMRKNSLLSGDVDLAEVASLAKNYSGAELTGVIKSATSFAFNRHVRTDGQGAMQGSDLSASALANFTVCREDFMRGLEEVPAAFGHNEGELKSLFPLGIIHFSDSVQRIMADGQLLINQVRSSPRPSALSCVLLEGDPGVGKTALAGYLAAHSSFPFVKVLGAQGMVGMSDSQRVAYIQRIFTDAHRSPLSLIVLDGIEQIIEYVPIGPRFSNPVLQSLSVLFKVPPPQGHRLLVIATSNIFPVLEEMSVTDAFSLTLHIPSVQGVDQLSRLIQSVCTPDASTELLSALSNHVRPPATSISIPVKRAIDIIDMALQDTENRGDLFLTRLEPYIVR